MRILFLCFILLFGVCNNAIADDPNLEKFHKLKIGMTIGNVRQILGPPVSDAGSGLYAYKYPLADGSYISTSFADMQHLMAATYVTKDGKVLILEK